MATGTGPRSRPRGGARGSWPSRTTTASRAGGSFIPSDFQREEWEQVGQPWTATSFVLSQLRELGLEPTCGPAVRAVRLIGESSRWDEGDQPFWTGETEECINGRTVADGAYYGVDVSPIVERLVGEQLEDGGWNCERPNGSTRSSFHTTINVLEGLLEHERAHRRHAGLVRGATGR